MNGKPRATLKLAILGEKQVGKTSLLTRYIQDDYNPVYLHTKGGDITAKVFQVGKKLMHVTIIDSAGHRYVRSLIKTLYTDVHGIMLVYDVTRRSTFDALDKWMHEIKLVNTGDPFILLVGNKSDLTRFTQVSYEEAQKYAEKHAMDLIECSAKDSLNVSAAFDKLLEKSFTARVTNNFTKSIKLGEYEAGSDADKRACCRKS